MLQWFRARASAIAAVAMLSMGAVGGSAIVPHEDDCHDACPSGAGARNPDAHRIGAASVDADSHPLHCLVCHWIRAFRPRTEARVVSVPSTEAAVNVYIEIVTVAGRAPVAQPPLRSPPAISITA